MIFEYTPTGETTLMQAFASSIGSKIVNGKIIFPKTFGQGYIQGYEFGPSLKLMINKAVLKEPLMFKRTSISKLSYGVSFTFHNILNHHTSTPFPSVQITSANMDYEVLFPANTDVNTIIIVIHVENLKELLNPNGEHKLLQNILSTDQPFFYEEILSPKMRNVAIEIEEAIVPLELNNFFLKIKAQELIYLFFIELMKRQNLESYPVNASDVKTAYQIRDRIISDLSIVPNLPKLAAFYGISESKMKRLFKQLFGASVYSYYQNFRMKEAAYLIIEHKLSVSEAGYKMGFANLSHFSRLFERYIGLKPKKYSAILRN